MNKKGLILGIMSIMSIFLLSFAYLVLVVERNKGREYNVGEKSLNSLVVMDNKFKVINMYYDQAFKNAILKSIVELAETGGGVRDLIWKEDPYPGIDTKFKALLGKNFQFYIKDIEIQLSDISDQDEITTYPKDFVFEIDKNKVKLRTSDELIIQDNNFGGNNEIYPTVKISRKLNIERDLGFNFGVYERLYNEFSKSNKCIETSDNFRNIKCVDQCLGGKNTLSYEIPLDKVSFVVPIVKFKIPKQCQGM